MGNRFWVGVCLGTWMLFGATGCANWRDPNLRASNAPSSEELVAEVECQGDDCQCEEGCHVKTRGCAFRQDVCDTGLQGCLLACAGKLKDSPEVVF